MTTPQSPCGDSSPDKGSQTVSMKKGKAKGAFARRLVIYCVTVLTAAGVWAAVVKTVDRTADLSDVLTFLGAAFGGELLLLLVKRVWAKEQNEEEL